MEIRRHRAHAFLAGVTGAALACGLASAPARAQAASGQTSSGDATTVQSAAPNQAVAVQPPAPDQAAASPNVPSGDTADKGADIVVTGSRVIKNGNNSPTPLTVVSAQDLLTVQPSSIAQGLATLPGLLGSLGTTSNVNQGGFNSINLRGVGVLRGLVLFDGHRVGPTQANTGASSSAVNIDVIPQFLLKRVDVVTGGASAVYGSDAVSGVVNFVPDTNFTGFKAVASNGISTYGDDRKSNVGLAWGKSFAEGRGHFEISYEYRDNAGLARSDRDWFNPIYTEQGSVPGGGSPGTAGNPYKLVTGAILSTSTFGGLIQSGPLSGQRFMPDGTLTPFVHGTASGTSGVEYGGDGDYYVRSTLVPSQRIHQAYSRFDYDAGGGIHAHVEGAYTNLRQAYVQQSILLNKLSFGYNNPYLANLQPAAAASVKAALAAAPAGTNPSFTLSEMDTSLPNNSIVAKDTYWMVDGGLDGSIGSNLKWNLDYYHTHSALTITNQNNINDGRLYAALNAVRNPANGQIVCNAALANPSVYGGCVPFDVFGNGVANPAAINYVEQPTSSTQSYEQNDVSATISGSAFTLPAGPVTFAVNGEYRHLTLGITSTAAPSDAVNCTGIQFNCSATSAPYFSGSIAPLPTKAQEVEEAALEVNVPILANKRFFEDLSLNAAGRFTHYNTSGNVGTWKVGGVWRINDQITLRATRSRDIRAPNLIDLYAPATVTLSQYVDLHTGASGVINRFSQGNPNLKPEKADTFTAGVVLKPAFASGFTLALDYYQITVNQAIVAIDPFQSTTQVACEASGGTSPLCALYVRPLPFSNTTAANFPTLLIAQSLNVASVSTHGLDVEANYAHDLGGHLLALRALFNWQPVLTFNQGPTGILQVAGSADGLPGIPPVAKVKLVASAAYDVTRQINVRVQERWRGSLKQNASNLIYFADGSVAPVAYTDANLTFNVNERFSASLNVQNLFNKAPPPFASSGGSLQPNYLGGFAQGDDIEGRFLTFTVRTKF